MQKLFFSSVLFLCLGFKLFAAVHESKLVAVGYKELDQGYAIDLNFNANVSAKSLNPVFDRNFIQFVLKNTKMDTAKILPVQKHELVKVFAYPYDVNTSRVRLILNTEKLNLRNRISLWNNNPKSVRVFIKGKTGEEKIAATDQKNNENEEQLLKDVVDNTKNVDISDPHAIQAALKTAALSPMPLNTQNNSDQEKLDTAEKNTSLTSKSEKDEQSIGIKTNPSKYFFRMVLALVVVLALFGLAVFLLRRYSVKLNKLPFGKKERLIQVVATHYLGSKKSISLVKIANEYMVMGVSNEGMSLISKLGTDINVDKYLEDRFWGGTFEKHLNSYTKDIASKKYDGVKDLGAAEVKQEAEMFQVQKMVTKNALPIQNSIKEKLVKLKPIV